MEGKVNKRAWVLKISLYSFSVYTHSHPSSLSLASIFYIPLSHEKACRERERERMSESERERERDSE